MEIVSKQTILKYLWITLLSYSRICHFAPLKAPKTRIKVRFTNVSNEYVKMRLDDIPKGVEGSLIFYSYTFIFRFTTRLRAGSEMGVYFSEIPAAIETFDRRKYARLKFESRENMVVNIHNKALNSTRKGILTDISAGGLGFVMADINHVPKKGDLIVTDVKLKEKTFQAFAEVTQVRNDHVGCMLLEKSVKLQLDLNAIVKREIDWRSEHMLKNLRKREEMLKTFHKAREEKEKEIQDISTRLNYLEPFLDNFCSSFQEISGTVLTVASKDYKESTAVANLNPLNFNVYFNSDALFQCYFSTKDGILYKLANPLFNNRLAGRSVNAAMIQEQLGKRLAAHSGQPGNNKTIFTFADSHVQKTDKRMISTLIRKPSFRVQFTSPLGDFDLTMLAENLEDSLNLCDKAREKEFITMEKMDLMEPISYAAIKVFSEYLKLEIREKSVTLREKLLPRFEISILLDIFFDDIEGKVILNLSSKLALKIYELLVNEKVDEFNNEVKDAVAEVTNMITGNAKSRFEEHGIYYKISTPVVVKSREGVIVFAKNMKFLSSVYWTSEGFFDLSFSFFKK